MKSKQAGCRSTRSTSRNRCKADSPFARRRLLFEPLEERALLAVVPLLIDLQPGSDSGLHDDDDITNIATATIDIAAAEADDVIRVYDDGTLLGEATQVAGRLYRYTFAPDQLTEGDNSITARSFDGVEESEDSPVLAVTLDTTQPYVASHSPSGQATLPTRFVDVTFTEAIDSGSFTLDDVSVAGPAGAIEPSGVAVLGGNICRVSFPQQTTDGVYHVLVGPDVLDIAGNQMGPDVYGPRVVAASPGEVNLQTHTFNSVGVRFSEDIDFDPDGGGSFTVEDVRIVGPQGEIAPDQIVWNTDYRSDGTNIAPLGTAIQSSNYSGSYLASSAIDGNFGNFTHTANDSDSYWRLELPAATNLDSIVLWNRQDSSPERLSNFRISVFGQSMTEVFGQDFFTPEQGGGNPGAGAPVTIDLPPGTVGKTIQVQFLGLNNAGNGYLSLAEVQVFRSAYEYQVNFSPQTEVGTYTVSIGPDIADRNENLMDQDEDGLLGEAADDVYVWSVDVFDSGDSDKGTKGADSNDIAGAKSVLQADQGSDSPVAEDAGVDHIYDAEFTLAIGPRIVAAEPDPAVTLRTEMLDSVTVTFNEAIEFNPDGGGSFTVDDVSIIGPEGEIAPTGITSLGNNEYQIGFDAQAENGRYTVSVGSDVTDLVGNPMDQDQDGVLGEAEEDIFTYDAEFIFAIGPRIVDAEPSNAVNLRTESFDTVTVTFNEAIDFDPTGTGSLLNL